MQISRRDTLKGAGAAVAVAGVPAAVAAQTADPEEAQLLTVFRLLDDESRALIHQLARHGAGLPLDPELWRRRGFKPDGMTPLDAGEA